MAGYNQPQPAKDQTAKDLYKKHGWKETPTMEQIEPVAIILLSNLKTAREGAELVLARRVSTSEEHIQEIIYLPISAREKFGLLLLQKSLVEEIEDGGDPH